MSTITDLVPEDAEAWRTLWTDYLDFYGATVPEEVTAATFRGLLHPAGELHGAVARDADGALLGLVHWLTHPATWTTGTYCYLEDLFVREQGRGAGVGRALIEHVRTWAAEQGCAKVYWLTSEANGTARALYDRVATRTGMIQYQIALDG